MLRDAVNLFITEKVVNLIKDTTKHKCNQSIPLTCKNCFAAKVLVMHLEVRSKGVFDKCDKIFFLMQDDLHTKGQALQGDKVLFNFKVSLNIDTRRHIFSICSKAGAARQQAQSFVSKYMGLWSMIANGDLAASDDLNRKDRRYIERKNTIKYPITGDVYKIISLGKNYHDNKSDNITDIRQREHIRRGHYRHYKETGKVVWIDAYKAGDPSLGTVIKDYAV